MSGKYFYCGVDINELIQSGGTTTPSGGDFFTGFPKCLISDLTTNFESTGLEGFIGNYKYQNTSIGTLSGTNINKIEARYINYNYTDGGSNTDIVVTPPTFCSHISAVCYGGDGGGGGGGGSGQKSIWPIPITSNGGAGGSGGAGGYVAAEKIPRRFTQDGKDALPIYLTIGKNGNAGGAGENTSGFEIESGVSGKDGEPGSSTILKIGNDTILTANGGAKGIKGNAGNATKNGGRGDSGAAGNGVVNTNNYGGESYYVDENTSFSPKTTRSYGGGGGAGYNDTNWPFNPTSGNKGSHGFCRIYFLYINNGL
jgi:hypothetical protein